MQLRGIFPTHAVVGPLERQKIYFDAPKLQIEMGQLDAYNTLTRKILKSAFSKMHSP